MTLSEVQKMADEELRVEVAKLAGFYDVRIANEPSTLLSGIPKNPDHENHRILIPNFPHDLNAVHEVEVTFDAKGKSVYASNLNKTSPLGGWMIFATARQRCEALVLTISES